MSHPELAIAGFYDHEEQTERRAPDWGGDDLFTTAPAAAPARPGAGDEDGCTRSPRDARRRLAPRSRTRTRATPHEPAARDLDRYLEPVPAGRRTVTITGRPDSLAVTRRPARTIDERIAHRPERIASWTCAMGFLLDPPRAS